MLKNIYIRAIFTFALLICSFTVYSQDTLKTAANKLVEKTDSLKPVKDSIVVDSASLVQPESQIKSPITHSAKDSMRFSLRYKKVYSYGDAKLNTEEVSLSAGYMYVDLDSGQVFADAQINEKGERIQSPILKQDGKEYKIKTIRYNIETKKGLVTDVVTEESGGYLHGGRTKIQPNKEIHIVGGKYTTCDAEHPHFYINLSRAKVIPDKKTITGPFWFVISDIPIFPFGLPFGFFPNQANRRSGIIIPSYGEEKRRGFFLQDLGYYWAAGENIDFTFLGSIYTSGSWTVKARSRYKKRYKYNGNFDISYQKVFEGEKDIERDYKEQTMFWVKLNYARDPKANPTSNFNVSIDFGSRKSRSYNSYDPASFANNNANSSIAYRKTFPGTPFNFSANIRATQNLTNQRVDLTLPTLTLNMNKQFPFKRKKAVGSKRWYEQISVGFSSQLQNKISTVDTLLFTKSSVDKFQNGFQYSIPISTSLKVLKHFNLSPSFSYQGRVYTRMLRQRPVYGYDQNGEFGILKTYNDTVPRHSLGFYHIYDYSFSTPLSTKLYGMREFKKGRIAAIRHVLSPSISFNYRPDFGQPDWGYYTQDIMYPDDPNRFFSTYGNGIFGTAPRGKSGSISLSVDNNLEMKVHPLDTAEKMKKIVLLNSFRFSSSYNLAADSMNFAPIQVSANTRLFKQISVNFSGLIDVYKPDTINGGASKVNKLYWHDRKLGHLANSNITLSGSINSQTFKKKKKNKEQNEKNKDENNQNNENNPDLGMKKQNGTFDSSNNNENKKNKENSDVPEYNFKIPWNLSISYSFRYNNAKYVLEDKDFEPQIYQTINLNGSLTITPKWSLNANATYDFTEKKLTYTNVSISRDLHCWQMGFNFVPFGTYKSYNFRINVKSSMFQGLEYKKQESFRDNFEF